VLSLQRAQLVTAAFHLLCEREKHSLHGVVSEV